MRDKNSLNAEISFKDELSPGLFRIRIRPDTGVPEFQAGQYVALGAMVATESSGEEEKLIKRSYSIASPPSDREALEFYIVKVDDGALTPTLLSLPVGARVHIGRRAVGTFVLPELNADSSLFFVSTGTGIAPFISMLLEQDLVRSGREIHLLHGVRFSCELGYRELLEQLSHESVRFHYLPIVSRDDAAWSGPRGYVQSFFKDKRCCPDEKKDHIFLCGNPAMIEELERGFLGQGFVLKERKTPGNLHCEKYW